MGKLIALFQNKVALAIIGAVLCGGSAAWIVSTPFNFSSDHSAAAQFQAQAGVGGIEGNTATPGAPTASSTPSTTPTPRSTRPPAPTATPGVQIITLQGTVGIVNTNAGTFTINLNSGGTKTVVVTGSTTYHNGLRSFSDLSNGLLVDVRGTYQPDGTFAATSVSLADN